MKAKTIEKILVAKVEEWLNTIKDEHVRNLAKKDTIVTGGSIASMLLNEKVNDFDIYFRTRATAFAVANYYAQGHPVKARFGNSSEQVELEFQDENYYSVTGDGSLMAEQDEPEVNSMFAAIGQAKEGAEPGEYKALFFTNNAITLSDHLQLVLRFTGEPHQLHKNYDYVHATNYYDNHTQRLTLLPAALESLLTRELRYIGSLYPVTSVIRSKKFIKRGWTISAGEYMKILFQVSQLDLSDPEVLRDQLSGIDISYFSIVIEALNNRDASVYPKVTYPYICEVIDRVFN